MTGPHIYRWRESGLILAASVVSNGPSSSGTFPALYVAHPPFFPVLRCRVWALVHGYGWGLRVDTDGGD